MEKYLISQILEFKSEWDKKYIKLEKTKYKLKIFTVDISISYS